MPFTLRAYHPSDLPQLYRICLLTGDSGKDASTLYQDPDLLGHVYAAPYAVHEPALCSLVCYRGKPVGYILGTADSQAFMKQTEASWFPILRGRYPLPNVNESSRDARLIRVIHRGYSPDLELNDYPAHLHIDLLPIAQGQGFGRQLMERFLNTLRKQNVGGVHLGVGKNNTKAIGFYKALGFKHLHDADDSVTYGMRL